MHRRLLRVGGSELDDMVACARIADARGFAVEAVEGAVEGRTQLSAAKQFQPQVAGSR